jgi:hypothetical protein
MKKYTLEQYKKMIKKFNNMSFPNQIKTIIDNKDIITLYSDHNFWGVEVIDKDMEEKLLESGGKFFHLQESEWGSREIHDLINLLGIKVLDM